MPDLTVHVEHLELAADWTGDNPRTRKAIEAGLPLSNLATRWGDELYIGTPVDVPLENGQEELPVGAIAYWPRGNAVCLFWGPTPASVDDEPRAASPVNLVARLEHPQRLDEIDGDAEVRIEAA